MAIVDEPVFILESPGPAELVAQKSEAAVLESFLRMIGIPVLKWQLMSSTDLMIAADVFRQLRPRVLHISGHGYSDGTSLAMTNGERCSWQQITDNFVFSNPDSYLVASACHSLEGGHLVRAAFSKPIGSPRAVLGFEQSLSWSQSTLASAIVYQALYEHSFDDLLAGMLASFLVTSASVVACFRGTDGNAGERHTGPALLAKLILSVSRHDRPTFERLIIGRGLDSKVWTEFWDDHDARWARLQEAMRATDAAGALGRSGG